VAITQANRTAEASVSESLYKVTPSVMIVTEVQVAPSNSIDGSPPHIAGVASSGDTKKKKIYFGLSSSSCA
jgi:hypothetical protein